MRRLIVNADDFGLSPGINLGVALGHEKGIVTAASLMVRRNASEEAATYAKNHSELSLGLHFDFGEWIFSDGRWQPLYQLVSATDRPAVEKEALRQLDLFRLLVGHEPTHIDSHQHFHREEPFASVLVEIAQTLSVPLRERSNEIHYCGSFYGQTSQGTPLADSLSCEAFIRILGSLSPGVTELSCHPAARADFVSPYNVERTIELQTLCNPSMRSALSRLNIQLDRF